MKMRKLLLAICAFGLLSSPASTQEFTKEEIATGIRSREMTRYVRAGKQHIENLGVYTPVDCTVMNDEGDVTIIVPPEHGTAAIEVAERVPGFPEGSTLAKCTGKKARMPILTYKAVAGYIGPDMVEVRILAGGVAFLSRYMFKVVDTGTRSKGRTDLRP
jgi:hypothetical protein